MHDPWRCRNTIKTIVNESSRDRMEKANDMKKKGERGMEKLLSCYKRQNKMEILLIFQLIKM